MALSGHPSIHIPATYPEYCTSKVLTMEFIDGTKLNDVYESTSDEFDKKLLAKSKLRYTSTEKCDVTAEREYRKIPSERWMAALGVLTSMLGFSAADQALMISLYIAMDSFGTACNVTGDGALALIVDRCKSKLM